MKVQPKSRRPGVQGRVPAIDGARLRRGVTEAAEDVRANRAVCATLADALAVPARQVSMPLGAASREKTLRGFGDPAAIIPGLAAL